MMHSYAAIAGLSRRRIQPVPVLSPSLSSLWIGLVVCGLFVTAAIYVRRYRDET